MFEISDSLCFCAFVAKLYFSDWNKNLNLLIFGEDFRLFSFVLFCNNSVFESTLKTQLV